MTCKKAQGYLEANSIAVSKVQDAGKEKQGPKEALALARSAARIVVARGKKMVTFDMKKDPPHDDTLLAHLLGPSGNLRAPTVRKGKTLLVGFSDELYAKLKS
jgi:arsenate reductase-like glutaredoxin family protein